MTEVGAPGQPLGIEARCRATGNCDVELSAGSTLVLYTDGVTEARDDTGDQFDDEGLLRVLGGHDCLPPPERSPRCMPPWRPT